jgi:hypothetical protein
MARQEKFAGWRGQAGQDNIQGPEILAMIDAIDRTRLEPTRTGMRMRQDIVLMFSSDSILYRISYLSSKR